MKNKQLLKISETRARVLDSKGNPFQRALVLGQWQGTNGTRYKVVKV